MEIKKYLPISTKKAICEQIVANSIEEKDGMLFIDFVTREISEKLSLIQFYTDLDINAVDYDTIAADGTLENIIKEIPESEYSFIDLTVEYMLTQELEVQNSISSIINKNLSKLIEKIPDSKQINKLIPKLSKELAKVSPDTLNLLKDISKGNIK